MDAPSIPISADFSKGNFGDVIDIGMDGVHPVPVAAVAFTAVTIVTTLARHGEAIQGIHEYLQGVPIKEEMSTLSQEKRARMEMERQLDSVQESQRKDRENSRKLQELLTS
ncbi:hypothetical protein Tco_0303022 [Tanacetum coccineum]